MAKGEEEAVVVFCVSYQVVTKLGVGCFRRCEYLTSGLAATVF